MFVSFEGLDGSGKTTQVERLCESLEGEGREVVTARADFPAGGSTGLHTHPGDEISFVAEGAVEIVMDGSSKVYRKGEAFNVIGGKPHDAKAVEGPAVVIANYVIEKGKAATTPVK